MGAEIGQVSIEIEARTDEVKRRDRIVLDWYLGIDGMMVGQGEGAAEGEIDEIEDSLVLQRIQCGPVRGPCGEGSKFFWGGAVGNGNS